MFISNCTSLPNPVAQLMFVFVKNRKNILQPPKLPIILEKREI